MKHLSLALAILLTAALPAVALDLTGRWEISPHIGGYLFEGNEDLEHSPLFGLGLGYNLSERWTVEGALSFIDAESDSDPAIDVDGFFYRLEGLYNLHRCERRVLYLAAGLGGLTLDPAQGSSDSRFAADYGIGMKHYATDHMAVRGDIRHVLPFDELNSNLYYSLGLSFVLGAAAPAPAPLVAPPPAPQPAPAAAPVPPVPPRDSDGDGVIDALDECPDTPAGVLVDEKGCELKLTLQINFAFDKAEILPEFRSELDKAAAFIQAHPEVPYILIAGHTDSRGDDSYNQQLSQRRADAVRSDLIANYQIEAARLVARGYGEAQPVASNETEDGRYLNRRVEVICCVVIPQ